MELSAVLTPAPEGGYVAFNPETGTTTQGETVEEALAKVIIPLTYGNGFYILITLLRDHKHETNYTSSVLQTVSR